MKYSILIRIILLLIIPIGMSNSVNISVANTQGYDAVIALVPGTDKTLSDYADAGLLDARRQINASVTISGAWKVDGINSHLLTFAQDAEFDIIITVGNNTIPGTTVAANTYPYAKFALIDGQLDLPNVASVEFKIHEAAFLGGAMAALTTSTDRLAFVGGSENDTIISYGAAYEQGARWINPDIFVDWYYYPYEENPDPMYDWDNAKLLGDDIIATGADILFFASEPQRIATVGLIDAAEEATLNGFKTYVINQLDYLYQYKKNFVLTSLVKRVDLAVKTQIDRIVAGNWTNTQELWGLKEGGVGINGMRDTKDEADADCGGVSRLTYVNSISEFFRNGSLIVNKDIVKQTDRNRITHNCSGVFYPEVTSSETISNTSSEDLSTTHEMISSTTEESSDASLPFGNDNFIVATLIILTAPNLIRRLKHKK